MKKKTFEKYARKENLRDGVYVNYLKKKKRLEYFFWGENMGVIKDVFTATHPEFDFLVKTKDLHDSIERAGKNDSYVLFITRVKKILRRRKNRTS